jgi:D-3-phosphoglycerate dehydrogenase
MSDTVENLLLDLLGWLGTSPRPYDEVLDAWRTSCPRLPVWEEANSRGFIERRSGPRPTVAVSPIGSEHLRTCRHQP